MAIVETTIGTIRPVKDVKEGLRQLVEVPRRRGDDHPRRFYEICANRL